MVTPSSANCTMSPGVAEPPRSGVCESALAAAGVSVSVCARRGGGDDDCEAGRDRDRGRLRDGEKRLPIGRLDARSTAALALIAAAMAVHACAIVSPAGATT